MKKFTFLFCIILLISGMAAKAQKKTDIYFSSSPEVIFSFANIDDNGNDRGNLMRFTTAINLQGMANFDFGNVFGLFTGLDVKNIGFIYDKPETDIKYKYRTYNLGVPAGFKIGKLDKIFFYAGYEIEFPFVYKEKTFVDNTKTVNIWWFSDRVEPIQQSFLVGVQLPYGFNLKFKYYWTNFHNQNFTMTENMVTSQPYKGLKANIFYFSLNFNLFTNWKHFADFDEYHGHHSVDVVR